ncbi:hypothetical protein PRIPAC_87905 [Pristionchus pacificus]|uniref:Lipase n=1 Tax=Pristionchus pacificus TaxID=54126 RepID=A0A2A6B5M1_PRIPA|nr:hypothetical protein PRIPAC_87905 [Pristionchus pacificus]|eukprot:PDM61151.1 hydrolase [Pristionchus pacificus]
MMYLLQLVVVLALFHFSSADVVADPEAYMTAIDLIKYWGYPAEEHEVHTADGYILNLFRIPHGRRSRTNSSCRRPAILLVHGMAGGASEFLLNPPPSCPAFLLADAGFDVFLMNHRGTTYSKRHESLKEWDNKYWQWTLDEMARYDSPAVIDRVLEISGEKGVYWVGHSQGTAMGYMTLADSPEYNSKVKGLFQLAPQGSGGYTTGIIRAAFWLYETAKPVVDFYRIALGSHEVSFQFPLVYRPLVRLCNIIPGGDQICDYATHYLFGPSSRTLNITRAPVYLSHIPSGTSTWNALHWAQLAVRRTVEHMDHNPAENVRRYGSETPPRYNYSRIDVPIYHFLGDADYLGTKAEMDNVLLKMLRKEVVKELIIIPGYNHIDYVVADDCAEMVFNPIATIVRNQESGMCEH